MTKKHNNALITFYTLLLFFFGCSLWAHHPALSFRAQPDTIELGSKVDLTWDVTGVPGYRGVYISNVGKVSPKGQITVAPEKKNTVYYLLCQTDTGPTVAETVVTVKGGRSDGLSAYPSPRRFTDGPHYQLAAPSLDILLDRLQAVLQDTMGFTVDVSYKRNQNYWVIITHPLLSPHLAKTGDRGIRRRVLAFRLQIPPRPSAGGTFSCSISTFIQYQRRKEDKWRTETDAALHRQCAQDLHNRYKSIK